MTCKYHSYQAASRLQQLLRHRGSTHQRRGLLCVTANKTKEAKETEMGGDRMETCTFTWEGATNLAIASQRPRSC